MVINNYTCIHVCSNSLALSIGNFVFILLDCQEVKLLNNSNDNNWYCTIITININTS